MIGIVIAVVILMTVTCIPGALRDWGMRRERRLRINHHHEEQMAAIQQGLTLPPLVLDPPPPESTPEPSGPEFPLVLHGLIFLAIALGLWPTLHELGASYNFKGLQAVAALPAAIGVACLLAYWLQHRLESHKPPAVPAAT